MSRGSYFSLIFIFIKNRRFRCVFSYKKKGMKIANKIRYRLMRVTKSGNRAGQEVLKNAQNYMIILCRPSPIFS